MPSICKNYVCTGPSSIQKYLRILAVYKKYSLQQISRDITIKGAVERYLYLVTQATIDLAEAVIAHKNFRKPTVYSETFEILREEKILSAALTQALIEMVGFRNVIAHDYEKVDFARVYEVLCNRLGDIEKFIAAVKKYLR